MAITIVLLVIFVAVFFPDLRPGGRTAEEWETALRSTRSPSPAERKNDEDHEASNMDQ